MNTEQIIPLVVSGLNLANVVFYFIIVLRSKKANKTNDLAEVMKNIPTYLATAKQMFGSNKTSIIGYVLAMLNKDCENLKVKYCEKTLKKEIEKELETKTEEVESVQA